MLNRKQSLRCVCLLLIALLLAGCTQNAAGSTTAAPTKSDVVTVDFYAINDLHGKLADGSNHPGVDELTTYLKMVCPADEYAILLSVGDMWQGSAESNLTYGSIMVDWMNELDFAAMTLGNHEYDWGESYIAANAEAAEFPFLAINVYDRTSDTLVDYCQPSVVIDCGEIQVGIIGAIGDCYSSISSDKVQDVYFKTGDALTALVKAESDRLRAEGVDVIVYSLHDGFGSSGSTSLTSGNLSSYYDVSLSDGYVDLVFEAHTHQKYLARDAYGVYHIQHGGDNSGGISHVELSFNAATGEVSVNIAELVLRSSYETLPDDPIVGELLEKYDAQISYANQVLGYNAARRSSSWLCQKVADLYLQAGLERWGDEYDIVLGGGFIKARSPYELAAGDVTYAMVQSIMPFDNQLVLCSIQGSDLLSKFINTSNENYYICRNGSETIDPNATYYVIVDSYTSTYGPNRLTEIERYDANVFARDLLAAYIKAGNME